ncbi:MAG: DUF2384 domain-containing protein [Proteobacteria bacterium]|nr:DUF2384 domain-containing protein [Pseudomonadota bacterium]
MQTQAVVRDLGGKAVFHKQVSSDVELVNIVHAGLPFDSLEYVLKEQILSKEEVLKLVTTQRSWDRRKASNKLSEDESDKLVRFLRIRAFAHQILGDEDAEHWLRTPNPLLEDKKPIELLDSDIGTHLVESLIGRIAYGIIH